MALFLQREGLALGNSPVGHDDPANSEQNVSVRHLQFPAAVSHAAPAKLCRTCQPLEVVSNFFLLNCPRNAVFDQLTKRCCGQSPSALAASAISSKRASSLCRGAKNRAGKACDCNRKRREYARADGRQRKGASCRFAGHHAKLRFEQRPDGLHVQLPAQPPAKFAYALRVAS